MTISISLLNRATAKPAVYFDRPDLKAYALTLSTDSSAPISIVSLRIRFPTRIFTIDQVANVTVASPGWNTPAAAGPFLTFTPTAPLSLTSGAPIEIDLDNLVSTNTAATTDEVQVFAGSEAPTAKLFLMQYPASAGDLTKVLEPVLLPGEVTRTPSTFDTIDNVLTLRLVNRDPANPLVGKPWVRTPTIRLSFVYGSDIGALTPADPPIDDPHSALNIRVDPVATYKDGTLSYEWTVTQPDGGTTDAPPSWTLQPIAENVAVLGTGSGATAEFRIAGLSTAGPAGSTLAYLQFTDFPGYADGYLTLPIAKVEPQPGVVFFDGTPNYVAAIGDLVTLEWQTVAIGRVALQQAGTIVDAALDAGRGSYSTTIDCTTDFALLAYLKAEDTIPAHTAQWTAHVPAARIDSFTADRTSVAEGAPVTLRWTTRFARTGQITGDRTEPIAQTSLESGSKTIYPRHPVTYTLHVTGESPPPDVSISIFVLPAGWAMRRMGFSPYAGQGPVLLASEAGLTLVGGQSANAIYQSSDGSDWEQTGDAPFAARNDAAGCGFADKLWIMGGLVGGRASSDVWSSPDGLNWTQVTGAAAWPARSNFACLAFAGKLWVIGGQDHNLQPLRDVWFSSDGANWVQASAPPWPARAGAAVASTQNAIWLFGGQLAGGVGADLWTSTDGSSWTSRGSGSPLEGGPQGRQRGALASLDGTTLALFGGTDASGVPLDDMNLFDGSSWDLGTGPSNWNASRTGSAVWRGAWWFAGGLAGGAQSDAVWSWFPGN